MSNDRSVRFLGALGGASTSRVLNLLRIHQLNAHDPEHLAKPLFVSPIVNKAFVLKLERDPFNSVPLGMTLSAETAAVTSEAGKDLGELNLQGVIVTLGERAAVINGQTVREGQLMKTPTGATIRAKRVTPSYCIVEGGGRVLMLKANEDAPDLSKKTPAKDASAARGVGKQIVAGTNP